MNLLGKPNSFFSIRGGDHVEIQFCQEARHKIADRRVVVYYQNRFQAGFGLTRCRRNLAGTLWQRGYSGLDDDLSGQPDRKDGALPRLALDVDLPFHQLNEPVSNGESQAGPTILAGNRGIRLGKLVKKVLLLLGGDSNPSVADPELNPRSLLYLDLLHVHGDGALIRKFAGVTEQVE